MTVTVREEVDGALDRGEAGLALAGLKQLFQETPTLGSAQFVLDRISKLDSRGGAERTACRIAFLRSFTLEPMVPLLRAEAGLYGLDVSVQVGEFNTYMQDVLNTEGFLYTFQPHIAVLAVQTRDLVPALWNRFADLSGQEIQATISQAVSDLRHAISTFRANSQTHLIVHSFELPLTASNGVLDARMASSQVAAIQTLNQELALLARETKGVYVLDYDALVARYGRARWQDARKWLTARMPIASDCLIHLAREYMRFVLPLMGKTCKALAIDLDNTLWGGVIGEDGMTGIKLSAEYPGAAFQELQRAILDLYQRGIILAACSKNNLADAMEAIENHPGMLLRPHHFAALRINWQDKAQNLREIARELNIGIDAVAFIDDNPVERNRVRGEVPEVQVIELPADPMGYAQALRDWPVFERLTLSAEDRERGKMYAENRQRAELEQSAGSLEDFYRGLKMEAEIATVTPETLARTAQLTQKTNQFNMTTRRYSEQQIQEMQADPAYSVYTLKVRDRFGDNGLVGIAIAKLEGEICEIDTFLLSCRVIGRTIETAIIAHIAEKAKQRGAKVVQGWFLPTKKNAPAKDFYVQHGFEIIRETEEGALWSRDIVANPIVCPEWVACIEK